MNIKRMLRKYGMGISAAMLNNYMKLGNHNSYGCTGSIFSSLLSSPTGKMESALKKLG
jgi:hypothetical protein